MVERRSAKVGATTAAANLGTRGERTTFQPATSVSFGGKCNG